MANPEPTGSDETREFYDRVGWRKQDGKVMDLHLFGVKEDGPIRIYLHNVHMERVRSALMRAGDRIKLLECGCGGNPATNLTDLCSEYTGIDFSQVGLEEAKERLKGAAIPFEVRQADVCKLPFDNDYFDAVYSAHMLYHIPDAAAQRSALHEMLRVVKPTGVLVLITANPRPLLFPVRLLKRLVADTPVVGSIANFMRPKPPVPYRPMPLHWYRRQMIKYGSVEFISYGLPSTAFNQCITEYSGVGRKLWELIRWLDVTFPQASAYLGNYVQVTVVKSVLDADLTTYMDSPKQKKIDR